MTSIRLILATLALLGPLACKSKQVQNEKFYEVQDNHWIDSNTLQLVSVSQSKLAQTPWVYVRKRSCQEAEKKVKEKMQKLYPTLGNVEYTYSVAYRVYFGEGGCKLIVHLTGANLKKKLS